ncbi:MAG: hypothetical protein ACJ72N_11450 [Labedaea sp.]
MGRGTGRSPEWALADLRALLIIVDLGVGMQVDADSVLHACAAPEEPAPVLARAGGRVAGEYHRLWAWSLDYAPYADVDSLERRVSTLLRYHYEVLHVALRIAFPKYRRTARLELQRQAVTGLGAPAAELRSVREELDLWIHAAS